AIAGLLASEKNVPAFFPYKSVEYADGVKGDEGGISLLRNGNDADLTTLIYKYTAHGLSHGHFDKLNINLYDKGNEILSDYGSARFVGVEQKYGGRYLPENDKYASQTIAHNTIVVDESSHFDGKEKEAEKFPAKKLFSEIGREAVQVVAASTDDAYKGTHLQRTVYLLKLPGGKKLVADIFSARSAEEHQYDLPFQYKGQLISTSFTYKAATTKLEPLGKRNGYQYLWKEAEAHVADTLAQFTFLNGQTYYSISALVQDSASLLMTRMGANDPNFNLRREPAFIIRKKGKDQTFVNIIEVHGKMDPVVEISSQSYPSVQQIKLLQQDDDFTIVVVTLAGKELIIAQCNKNFAPNEKHAFSKEGRDLQ
ncbi:MAG: heparinase, partial [Chitinophagaceae bacterium]